MPPKTTDGGLAPYDLYFEDGRPVTIETVELPPEPGWEPPVFGSGNEFTLNVWMPRAKWRRIIRGLNAAANRMNRIARTAKRRREKARRNALKGKP